METSFVETLMPSHHSEIASIPEAHNTDKKNWQKMKIQQSKTFQNKAFEAVNNLVVKKRNGRVITLDDNSTLIEFMSCSYLGLDQHPAIVSAATQNIQDCGVIFSVARTRLRLENGVILEELLNQIFGGYSVTFTSLHLIHLGMIPLIASGEMPSYPIKDQGPLFILDKNVHASVQVNRGLMEQFGEVKLCDFSDLACLEDQMRIAHLSQRTPIILADSVGSMGGLNPIVQLSQLAEQYDGYLYLDDAHGVSVYGKQGQGFALAELGAFHPRLILATSLSKGFGTNGGVIVVPHQADEQFIRQYCIPYLFSHPCPTAIVNAAIASAKIHLSEEIVQLQNRLQAHIRFFDHTMSQSTLINRVINYGMSSPVRAMLIGDEFKAIQLTAQLRNLGFGVTAAMYPTVARNKSILRITLGADHHLRDIQALCSSLELLLSDLQPLDTDGVPNACV